MKKTIVIKNETNIMPLKISTTYVCGKIDTDNIETLRAHFHDYYEIYVNVNGDVSFVVEDKFYKINSGDIILTRPYENHHCVFNQTDRHDHFCISFVCENNNEFLNTIKERTSGEGNLISLNSSDKATLINLCRSLTESSCSELKKHISFLSILELITQARLVSNTLELPDDLKNCIEYIHSNLTSKITVKEMAANSHVTVNSLERHFKTFLGVSPYTYLQNSRLAYASHLLEKGASVTDAATNSGFTDYSHFIALFKKRYGKTPLKFQKSL